MINVTITGTVDSNMRATMQAMLDLGYTPAMVAGVCGNIKHESNYDPSKYKKSKNIEAFGLCQWKNNYEEETNEGTKMKTWVGEDWKINISGQVQYMDYTLNSGYGFLKSDILSCANTYSGTLKAMELFLKRYILGEYSETEISIITSYTKEAWDAMTFII